MTGTDRGYDGARSSPFFVLEGCDTYMRSSKVPWALISTFTEDGALRPPAALG